MATGRWDSLSLDCTAFFNSPNYRLPLARIIHMCALCVPLFLFSIISYMCQKTVFVEVASGLFYFGCKVKHLLSCSVSTGSIQRVIIALVYSVNACQMDAAAAACAKILLRKMGKEKRGSTLISSCSFTSMVNS